MTTLKIPNLGESITNATIISLHIKVGDKIDKDDIILELETDKATVDIPADKKGEITKVLVKIGDSIKQGQAIAEIKETSKVTTAKKQSPITDNTIKNKKNIANQQTQEIFLQELGDGIKEASVLKLFVEKGQIIKQGDILLEVETDKATIEIPSNKNGKIQDIFITKGQITAIGAKIFTLEVTTESQEIDKLQDSKTTTLPTNENKNLVKTAINTSLSNESTIAMRDKILIPASPIVRRFAREIGVDLTQITGTLARGRICIEDVKTYTKKQNQFTKSTFSNSAKLPDFTVLENVERINLNKTKQVTASMMAKTWQIVPHVTNFHEADITSIENTRKKYKNNEVNLTITIILTKACAIALQKFPNFNASYDSVNQQLILKKYINLGLAVETSQGLVVPVIQNVDKKNIATLATEITDISQKARNRKLTPDKLQGQSFTISSLGGVGNIKHFTPLINYPDVAILGIARSSKQAKYVDGVLVPRIILPLSLSYDHRVIDGADATRFMDYLIFVLEEPFFPFAI